MYKKLSVKPDLLQHETNTIMGWFWSVSIDEKELWHRWCDTHTCVAFPEEMTLFGVANFFSGSGR